MKWIKKDLKEIIEKYLEGNDFHKPLMIIVRTNHGSSNPIVDDCHDWMVEDLKAFWFQESPTYGLGYLSNYKIERIADHPDIQIPIYSDAYKAEVLLYHRWLSQLEPQHLEYVVAISRTLQKPTICLINDYIYDACGKEKQKLSDFNVIFYNGDMSITDWRDWLDFISSKKELLPEIEEFVKNELETVNDSKQSIERCPWLITSSLFPRILVKINANFKIFEHKYGALSSFPREKIIGAGWSIDSKDTGERIADFIEKKNPQPTRTPKYC